MFDLRSQLLPVETLSLSWPLLVYCTHSASAGVAGVDLVWLLKSDMDTKLHIQTTAVLSYSCGILHIKSYT